jgi:hypothetical protein
MSTSLIVVLPAVLLGIVGLLCFVGCILDTSGLPGTPFTAYTNNTVANMLCIGYWPLKEKMDTDDVSELISDNRGKYIDPATRPALYPWPAYNVQSGAGPDVLSAAGAGMITLGQPTIVAGDVDLRPGAGDPVPPGCMVVNGSYVEVSWNDKFIPKNSFTVEAWVRPDWTVNNPNADRFVLDLRDFNPGTGFALTAQADPTQPGVYHWAGIMGNGASGGAGFTPVVGDEIKLASGGAPAEPVYLAMTYDAPNQTLTLFVNGGGEGGGTKVLGVPYMPNMTQPLWIGAGASYVPRRPQPLQPPDVPASPLFPFVGAIQDVAIWRDVLAPSDILTRFNNGSGNS